MECGFASQKSKSHLENTASWSLSYWSYRLLGQGSEQLCPEHEAAGVSSFHLHVTNGRMRHLRVGEQAGTETMDLLWEEPQRGQTKCQGSMVSKVEVGTSKICH